MLAKAVDQSTDVWLTHCIREQARSHFGSHRLEILIPSHNRTGPDTNAGACNDHILVVGRMNT